MRLWIFSDLHLTQTQESLFTSFLKALDEPSSPEDQVVFAGDIFDLLVGDSRYFSRKYSAFIEQVQKLSTRGVKLWYIEGNHDFHIKKLFQKTSVHFEEEAVVLSVEGINGKKMIYIAHGDLVDQEDKKYLALRKMFRSPLMQELCSLAPGGLIEMIGNALSRPHEQKAKEIPEHWSADSQKRLRQIFRNFALEKQRQGFDYVVLGHCHDLDDLKPFYWNMGYPPVHRQFLYYDSTTDEMKRRLFP